MLITPVMGGTAIPVRSAEGRGALRTMLSTSRASTASPPIWNHLGNPAASVPAGIDEDGMPLAVQLIGRPGDEATLLSLAAQIEAERPWAEARPRSTSRELGRGLKTLRKRRRADGEPRGRSRRPRIERTGLRPCIEIAIHSGQLGLEGEVRVRRLPGLGPGGAVVDHQVPGIGVAEPPLGDQTGAVDRAPSGRAAHRLEVEPLHLGIGGGVAVRLAEDPGLQQLDLGPGALLVGEGAVDG